MFQNEKKLLLKLCRIYPRWNRPANILNSPQLFLVILKKLQVGTH
jgi:hypothetical protein